MPCQVAMEGPDTRIVGEELDDCVSWSDDSIIVECPRKDMNVASHWIAWVRDMAIPSAISFSQNLEVVPVKMLQVVSRSFVHE